MATFEAHGLSALDSLPPETRFECGVCWRVYDPAEGDDYWQIPGGTSFAGLPEHWTCPNCDTPREKFVALDLTPPTIAAKLEALHAHFVKVGEEQMKGLPAYNENLKVETVAFRPYGEEYLGILITPWFMNVTVLPQDPAKVDRIRNGDTAVRALPSGEFEFVMGRLNGIGPVLSCSLFSPMEDFASHNAAIETAYAAIAALFNKNLDAIELPEEQEKKTKENDRRSLIFGRSGEKSAHARNGAM